jgi:hypothetical protein
LASRYCRIAGVAVAGEGDGMEHCYYRVSP